MMDSEGELIKEPSPNTLPGSEPSSQPIPGSEPAPSLQPLEPPQPQVTTPTSLPESPPPPQRSSEPPPPLPAAPSVGLAALLKSAAEKIQFRKRKRLEKIMQRVREKGRITNDEVQKLLWVSDATATRYLSQLVREGRLRRVGSPKHASYEPLP